MQSSVASETGEAEFLNRFRKRARANGPGLIAAALLHGLAVALIVLLNMQIGSPPDRGALRIVPVDVVQLAERTSSPPLRSAVPQERRVPAAQQEQASPVPPQGVSPQGARPLPLDNLDAKLRALARLQQPETNPAAIANSGEADATSASDEGGDAAAYGVRDFVRQHVVRHWSLDLHLLAGRSLVIAIHVAMARNGTVLKAEIVDMKRYASDAVFRDIALSARNAVLLSSPVPLPAGRYAERMDMVLDFNPRDALQ